LKIVDHMTENINSIEELSVYLCHNYDIVALNRFCLALKKFYEDKSYIPSKEQIFAICKQVLKIKERDILEKIAKNSTIDFIPVFETRLKLLEKDKNNGSNPQASILSNSMDKVSAQDSQKTIEELRSELQQQRQLLFEEKRKNENDLHYFLEEIKAERRLFQDELLKERNFWKEELKIERKLVQDVVQTVHLLLEHDKEASEQRSKVQNSISNLLNTLK